MPLPGRAHALAHSEAHSTPSVPATELTPADTQADAQADAAEGDASLATDGLPRDAAASAAAWLRGRLVGSGVVDVGAVAEQQLPCSTRVWGLLHD